MKKPTPTLALTLLALLGLAACGGDSQPDASSAEALGPDGMGQEMDPEMMALIMEAQQLQQELAPIQQQAMQDPGLSAQLEGLQTRVETAMREGSGDLLDQMDRFEEEFMAAQEAGDEARMQEIGMAAQSLQGELQAAQQAVLDRPEIQAEIEAFEAAQRERMVSINPEAGELMDRLDALFAQLSVQ